ncbi:MAG TPA: Gfo/Idh/MocA family oxidoreductase [Armatimonadetes bacterium]|jgi:predicted dehydrogenase|nr:Gfo/Idh/MocA family oxidoreductase [Armatimonadota bacterium]
MSKTRVGIIGCGGMARSHASRFSMILDQVEITATVDVVRERAQAVADLLPGEVTVSEDYREILDKVDAVLLVLPHHLHHPVTLECLAAGKHVLVEKPMANSEQECLEMIEAAKRADRVLMVAYCMRFHPLVVKMKELIDAKTYGDVFQLSIWTEQLTRYPEDHWASSAKTLGGGQLFSHGCHYIDLLLWMLGKPVWGTHFGTNTGTPWMEREGTSNVTIEFEGGVMGYHMGTWGARGSRLKYSFHAHCTEGMIEADISHGRLIAHSKSVIHDPANHDAAQAEEVLLEIPHAKPTEVEMAHFIECIRTGKKPLTDPVSSLEGLQVIWKLYEAEEKRALANLRGMGFGSLKL